MTEAEYRAHPAHSYSALKNALQSGELYHWRLSNPMRQTHDMLIGTLAEKLILDGSKLEDIALTRPKTYPATKTSTAVKKGLAKEGDPIPWNSNSNFCQEWEEESEKSGKPLISDSDAEAIIGMRDAVAASVTIQNALKMVKHTQVPMFGELPGFPGFQLKGLADMVGVDADGMMFIMDLKTCQDVTDAWFKSTIRKLAYDMQAALYCELAKQHFGLDYLPGWAWLAVKKKPMHQTALWFAGENLIERGRRRLVRAVSVVEAGERTGVWPGVVESCKADELDISKFELDRDEEETWSDECDIPY